MRLLSKTDLTAAPPHGKGLPLSKSALYREMDAGRFPRPIKCGALNAWIEEEVDSWIAAQRAKRDARFGVPKHDAEALSQQHPGANDVPRTATAADEGTDDRLLRRGRGRNR